MIETFLFAYLIWTVISFCGSVYSVFEFDVEHTLVGDLLDECDFNVVGRICISLLVYILVFPGAFIVDIFCFFRIIFTFHPQKKKKVKKSEMDEIRKNIDDLLVRNELLDREISKIKETIFIGED